MKEKISRNKISGHYKSFFGLENMGLGENDNLMIDWGESLVNDFCNQEVEKRIAETVAGKFIAVEIEKRIADRFPSKEKILKYFNNHFNCHADVIIGDYETTEVAMTDSAVLKMFEWILSCLTCSEKPNNSQKTEGGEG